MSVVCPTVTAHTPEDYAEQMQITEFADYIHIDLADGEYAPKLIDIKDVWWPNDVEVDIHLMYRSPNAVLAELIALQPSMVVIHADADGDLVQFGRHLKEHGIRFGISFLPDIKISSAVELICLADHGLIFSGSLGKFGGVVDMSLLKKASELRSLNHRIEIGWDGGINRENIGLLAKGGVDVLNVGGSIQKSLHPYNAYRDLVRLVEVRE